MGKTPYRADVVCLRCGWSSRQTVDPAEDREWVCPKCGSNSIRIKRAAEEKKK